MIIWIFQRTLYMNSSHPDPTLNIPISSNPPFGSGQKQQAVNYCSNISCMVTAEEIADFSTSAEEGESSKELQKDLLFVKYLLRTCYVLDTVIVSADCRSRMWYTFLCSRTSITLWMGNSDSWEQII